MEYDDDQLTFQQAESIAYEFDNLGVEVEIDHSSHNLSAFTPVTLVVKFAPDDVWAFDNAKDAELALEGQQEDVE